MAEKFIAIGITTRFDGRGVKLATDASGKLRDEYGKFATAGKKAFDDVEKAGTKAAISIRERFRNLSDGLKTVGTTLTASITAPLTLLGATAVKSARDMDSLQRGMVAVSGSAAKARAEMTRLREVAKLPGLGFKEAIEGSVNLQAAGLSADLARRSLSAFGNALATVGKGKAELDGVNLALSQIVSKGKVSAEEINQIAERVPQIRKAMIAAFGTADTEVLQKRKILANQFITGIITELERLPKVTGGVQNSFENLQDTVEQALVPLGNAILRFIVPAIETITPMVERLSDSFARLNTPTQNFIIGVAGIAAAIGPATLALGAFISSATTIAGLFAAEGALTLAVSGFGATLAGVFASTGPVGIAIVGAAALAGGLYFLAQRSSELQTITLQEAQAHASQAKSVNALIPEIKAMGGAVFVTKEEQLKLKQAYEALNPAAQARIDLIKNEADIASQLAKELEALSGQQKTELLFNATQTVAEFEKVQTAIKETSDTIARAEKGQAFAFEKNDLDAAESYRAILKAARADLAAHKAELEQITIKLQALSQAAGLNARDFAITAQTKGLIQDYQKVADALEAAIKAQALKTKQAATDVGKQTTGALKEAVKVGDFKEAGASIGDGLVIGMESKKDAVRAKAAELGKTAAQATRDAVQSKSPSRVFQKIGSDIGEGLKLGIQLKAAEVKKVLADLLKEATATAKEIAQFRNPRIVAARRRNDDLAEQRSTIERALELERELQKIAPGGPRLGATITPDQAAEFLRRNEPLKEAFANLPDLVKKGADVFVSDFVPGVNGGESALRQLEEASAALGAELDREIERTTSAAAKYDSLKSSLQGVIDSAEGLTLAQRAARDIAKLPADFNPLQRAELERLAGEARGIELRKEEEERQREQLQRAQQTAQRIGDFFTQAFRDSFERGPKAFFDRMWQSAKETLARIGAEITKNLVLRLANLNGGGQQVGGAGNAGASGGGGILNTIFGSFGGGSGRGSGFSIPGIGPGGTAPFVPSRAGGAASSVGGFRGLINQATGFNLFKSAPARLPTILPQVAGRLPLSTGAQSLAQNLVPLQSIPTNYTGGVVSGAASAAPSAIASLASGGLLLGGGLLGKFAGGDSKIGQLLGFGGGSLLAGAAGGAGLFGGGIAGALPALFSNPITAVIGGALLAGALAFRLFGNKDLKDYRKLINSEYAVDIKENKVLSQFKQLGQEVFGKEWKRKKLETIRLDPAKNLIANYAEAHGQGNNKLALEKRKLDANDPINRFEIPIQRREFGGRVWPGEDYLIGERRAEVVRFDRPGTVFPSVQAYQQHAPQGVMVPPGLLQALTQTMADVHSALARIGSIPPDQILMRNAEAVANAANAGRSSRYAYNTFSEVYG